MLVTGLTSNPGGVEAVVVNFVRRLQGHIQFDFWANTDQIAFQEELEKLGCGVFRGASYSRNPMAAHRDLVKFLKEHAGKYDVLWSNKSMCANVDDLLSAKRAGIPRRIIHAHNSRDMFTGPVGRLKAIRHRRNVVRLARLATDFWTCSSGAAAYFSPRVRCRANPYLIIHNAVDPMRYEFDPAARDRLRRELGIENSSPLVGFVGRLQFQKYPELAIDAFKVFRVRHPAAVLVMVGDGDLRSVCEAKVREAWLDGSVHFIGVRRDISEWYSAFDVLIMPSRFEGLPLAPVEAQAASLPVVASDAVPREAAFTDLVRFVPHNLEPDVWAESLAAAVESPRERGPMTEAVTAGGYDIVTESARVMHLLEGAE